MLEEIIRRSLLAGILGSNGHVVLLVDSALALRMISSGLGGRISLLTLISRDRY